MSRSLSTSTPTGGKRQYTKRHVSNGAHEAVVPQGQSSRGEAESVCVLMAKELAVQTGSSGKASRRSNVYIKMEVQGVEHRGGHYSSGSDRRRP